MNIDKIYTDIFDFIARKVGESQREKHEEVPDLTGLEIGHLIDDEMLSDPEKLYEVSDDVPDIVFKRAAALPFIDICDGRFASPVETPFAENNTVYVKHYRLKPKKRGRPAVVMMNGLHLDNNFYFDWWCWRFAAWGLDSVLITLPYSQERVPAGSFSGQYTFTPETHWTFLSLRQAFLDAQLLVNWLRADGAGDVGAFGVSFGALVSGIYVCQARNAEFTILGMPPVDLADILGRWSFGPELKEREAAGETTMLSDGRAHRAFNMGLMEPKIPLNKFFLAQGEFDHLVPAETTALVAERWGGLPWRKVYPTGHINTFVFNRRFIRDARRFVHREIL